MADVYVGWDPMDGDEVLAEMMEGTDILGARKRPARRRRLVRKRRPVAARPAIPLRPSRLAPIPKTIQITADTFLRRAKGGYFVYQTRQIQGKSRQIKLGRIFRRPRQRVLVVFPLHGATFAPATLELIRSKLPAPDSTYQIRLVPRKVAAVAVAQIKTGKPALVAARQAVAKAVPVVAARPAPGVPVPGIPAPEMETPIPETEIPTPEEEAPPSLEELPPADDEEVPEDLPEEKELPETDEVEEDFEEEEEAGEESEEEMTGVDWNPWARGAWTGPPVREWHDKLLGSDGVMVGIRADGRVEIIGGFDGCDDADEVSSEGLEGFGGF